VDYFSRYFFVTAYVVVMLVTGCILGTSTT